MKRSRILILALLVVLTMARESRADVYGKAARELVEFLMQKSAKEVAEHGAEKLAGRIAGAAARHGDDVLGAVRKIGPRALNLAEEAGEHAPRAMRFVAEYGDDAARFLSRPKGMALFADLGDDATRVLMKHAGVGEPLVEGIGRSAVDALGAVGARNGRRLAMMAEGGELAAIGKTPELMAIIAKYGDPAMEFIWRHKGALAVGTTLTAFLTNPQAFIDGTNQLTTTVAENAVKPAVTAAGHVAEEATGFLRWSLTILLVAVVAGVGWAGKSGAFEKPAVGRAAGFVAKHVGKAMVKKFGRS
jgi:hypothetical protein